MAVLSSLRSRGCLHDYVQAGLAKESAVEKQSMQDVEQSVQGVKS